MKASELQLTTDGHPSEQSASAAVRYIRPILKWAAASSRGYVSPDVAALTPPATVAERDRVLSDAEMRAVLPALRASGRPYAAAMRFMLLTLARREEVCAARWRDVDWLAGTLRFHQTKNGTEHVCPLPWQAIDLLRARMPDQPDPAALIFATSTGARLGNWDREAKAIHEASGIGGWTRHDLRRTGATMLGDLGTDPHVIEAALNHAAIVGSKVAKIYNRSRYRPQVATALQMLADTLDGIEAGASPASCDCRRQRSTRTVRRLGAGVRSHIARRRRVAARRHLRRLREPASGVVEREG